MNLAGGSGGALSAWYFLQRDTSFTTTDTTSPGTVILSQSIEVRAADIVEIIATVAGNVNSAAAALRVEMQVDGVVIPNAKGGATMPVVTSVAGGSAQWLGRVQGGGVIAPGTRVIALALWTSSNTLTVDPVSSQVQHADLSIKVFRS